MTKVLYIESANRIITGWENMIREYVPKPIFRKIIEASEFPRWSDLCKRLGATDEIMIEIAYSRVIAEYADNSRHYHTMIHILDCLIEFEAIQHLLDKPDVVEMALWLHDLVYNTRKNDNEEQSAISADLMLTELGIEWEIVRRVMSLIMSTKFHECSNFRDYQFLSDVDLSILGADPKTFDEYEIEIRKEYSWVTDEDFRKGRGEILKKFIQRENIFFTDYFLNKYELQARENITRSLQRLSI